MSTPLAPSRPAAVEAARQQLEELDALLERMLAIPVGPPEDDTLEELAAAPPEMVDRSRDRGRANSDGPVAEPRSETPVVQQAVPPNEVPVTPPVPPAKKSTSVPVVRKQASRTTDPKRKAEPPARVEDLAGMPWPIALLDWAFRFAANALAAPCRWLDGETGRALLGGAGLLLLAAALAWAILDWLLWNW